MPTIIQYKQSDVAVFYSPHCFIVLCVRETLSGGPRDLSGHVENAAGAIGGALAPVHGYCICYMSWWTILESLLFFTVVCLFVVDVCLQLHFVNFLFIFIKVMKKKRRTKFMANKRWIRIWSSKIESILF